MIRAPPNTVAGLAGLSFHLRSKQKAFLIFLSLCQDASQVRNRVTRAFHCAHAAAQAQRFVDHRMVVNHPDGLRRACLFTDPAADTAYGTDFSCFLSLVFIDTFHYNIIGAFMEMDDLLRAGTRLNMKKNFLPLDSRFIN